MRLFAVVAAVVFMLWAAVADAAYPYDSACKVYVKRTERSRMANGGSGVLIAVKDDKALVLTVKHVAIRAGSPCTCEFGELKVKGNVLAVHPSADVALLIVERPKDIKPVPLTLPSKETGPFVLAGYPGYDRETLRYQVGEYVELTEDELIVTSRPEKGMSGGPAYDKYGRVVGTVSAYSRSHGICGSGEAMMELVQKYVE